jgi:leucyl aminopeptidase (aminopeptidase T)
VNKKSNKTNPYQVFYEKYLMPGKKQIIAFLVDNTTDPELLKNLIAVADRDENIIKVLMVDKKPYAEPKNKIDIEILKADYVIELTKSTFLYTKIMRRAIRCKTKFYFLSGIDRENFEKTCLKVDPLILKDEGEKLVHLIKDTKYLKIITSDGAELQMRMNRYKFYVPLLKRFHYSYARLHSGLMNKKTDQTFIPSQVVFRGIRETINGRLTMDGSLWLPPQESGLLTYPISFKIKRGLITEVTGSEYTDSIKRWLRHYWMLDSKIIQHFSIGLNPLFKFSGNMIIDERVKGALTVGFGKTRSHFDITARKPTIFLDDKILIDKGKLLL